MFESKLEHVQKDKCVHFIHVEPTFQWNRANEHTDMQSDVWFPQRTPTLCFQLIKPQSCSWAKSQRTKVFLLFFIQQIDKAGSQDRPGQLQWWHGWHFTTDRLVSYKRQNCHFCCKVEDYKILSRSWLTCWTNCHYFSEFVATDSKYINMKTNWRVDRWQDNIQ